MDFTGKVLSDEEILRIHRDSMRILEETGVKMPSEKVLAMLEDAGADIDHDGEMLEGTMALTKYKAPVLMYPMPACGSTGSASLYSNIALANAESLSSLVIYQLTTPGTPLIYGVASICSNSPK